jgi:hypothetical protein
MDQKMPHFPWSEPWSPEAFQHTLTQFDHPPTDEPGETSEVTGLAFVTALVGRATSWAEAIQRRINVAEASKQGKPAFVQIPVPASLSAADQGGKVRREYELTLTGSETRNVQGDVLETCYQITLDHNRGDLLTIEEGYPLHHARISFLKRLMASGREHSYHVDYHLTTRDLSTQEWLETSFTARIDAGQLFPEHSGFTGHSEDAHIATMLHALEVLNKVVQFITPLTLKEAIRQLRAAARTLQQEQTQAAGDAFDQVYEDLQRQLSDDDCDQLFQVMMTLYCLNRI